jgi:signal transduction histidine kinase
MTSARPTLSGLADAALALVLFGAGVWFVLGKPLSDDVVEGPTALNVAAVALMTLPLVARRRAPLAVALTVFATVALRALVADPLETYTAPLAAVVAIYSVAAYGTTRAALAGMAAAVPAVAIAAVQGTGGDASPDFVPVVILLGLVWTIGRVAGTRYARAWSLDRRREEEAAAAVAAERERIARELHDSVSHSLAVIAMQAGGAEGIIRKDPDRAAASLRAIERTAREGLTEMRRLLDLIAPGEETADLQPQPGIHRLPALIDNARSAGLDVTFAAGGDTQPVPPGVDLSAYRIVQEALTNAAKHGGACRTQVVLNWLPAALEIEVLNDAAPQAEPNGSRGRGLIGMRERAELVGGRFEAGPDGGGRYRVWAWLPLERTP